MHFVFGLSYCAVSMVESSKRVYESQERKEGKKKRTKQVLKRKSSAWNLVFSENIVKCFVLEKISGAEQKDETDNVMNV